MIEQELHEIPSNWVWAHLVDVADINPKLPYDNIDDDLDVSFLPMKTVEEETGKIDLSIVRKYGEVKKGYTRFIDNDILFAKITPCMENGKIAITKDLVNGIGFGSTEFHVVRLRNDNLSEKFFFHYLVQKLFRRIAEQNMTGTVGQKRVPTDYIKDVFVPIPPVPEQVRIVFKLEELFSKLDAAVGSLQRTKIQLERYQQSFLRNAFDGRLTEEWRSTHEDEIENAFMLLERVREDLGQSTSGRRSELLPIDDGNLPDLPEGWVRLRLGDISEFRNGINFRGTQKGNSGILTVDVLNMYSKGIHVNLDNLYRVDIEPKNHYLLKNGDILFVRSSVKREGIGWVALFKESQEPVTFCGFIIRARLRTREILPQYLTYLLRTNSKRAEIIMNSSEGPITNISQGSLSRLLIVVPPLVEQHKIVDEVEHRFSIIDATRKEVEQGLMRAERLRQTILKEGFKGKLVNQNPSDEPASVLLKRIKKEKRNSSKGNRATEQLRLI